MPKYQYLPPSESGRRRIVVKLREDGYPFVDPTRDGFVCVDRDVRGAIFEQFYPLGYPPPPAAGMRQASRAEPASQ
jgi:hypothetical protein